MVKIISIEGNIGSGKTTIVEKLQEKLKYDSSIVFLREPVDIWMSLKDENGENILEKFYNDPSKYAFTFQITAFVTRLSMIRNIIKENKDCNYIICERSLSADKHIFAKMLYDDGMIDDIHYKIYMKFYEEFSSDYELEKIIYIDADPDICKKRIHKRSRNGEEGITLDYLEKCKKYHDEWLLNMNNVITIKTNENVKYENNDNGIKWLNEIIKCIKKTDNKEKDWCWNTQEHYHSCRY